MANKYADRVWCNTASTGTGTVTLGTALAKYFTPVDLALADGDTYKYVIEQGNDVEEGSGVLGGSGTTLTRVVSKSKIAGVVGTTPLTLAAGSTIYFTHFAADIETTFTSSTGLSAAGTTSGTATALAGASDNQLWEVTTATAKQGVILPVTTASFRGTVVNSTATVIFLYPPSGRSLHPFLAADIPLQIPPGGSIEVASKNTSGDYYQTNGDGWVYAYKTADSSFTSNTTLASDADMQFAMAASKKYMVESLVIANAPSSGPVGGLKIADTGPASPTQVLSDINGAAPVAVIASATAYSTILTIGTLGHYRLDYKSRINNGVNAGTFALQFAQGSSNATASVVYTGSYLRYKLVP